MGSFQSFLPCGVRRKRVFVSIRIRKGHMQRKHRGRQIYNKPNRVKRPNKMANESEVDRSTSRAADRDEFLLAELEGHARGTDIKCKHLFSFFPTLSVLKLDSSANVLFPCSAVRAGYL